MGAFEGSARLLGEIIGFGITAVLFIVCVLPSYFILKLMSGSKTSFTEDVKEYLAWRWRPQPRPETSRMLSTLDSVESTVLEIYKYVLILGLVLASVFIGWLFINAHNDAARSPAALFRRRLLASGRLGCWQPGDDQTAASAALACRDDSNRLA